MFPSKMEWFAAGHEYLELGGHAEQVCDERRSTDNLLKVIEDEQELLPT